MREDIISAYTSLYGQLNKETRIHSMSVAGICESCAPVLGLDPGIAFKVGLLHDVGKLYVPARILKKNKKLNSLEREVVDLHAYFGYHILKIFGEPPIVYIPVLYHHGFKKPRLTEPDEPMTHEFLSYICLLHTADIFRGCPRASPWDCGSLRATAVCQGWYLASVSRPMMRWQRRHQG